MLELGRMEYAEKIKNLLMNDLRLQDVTVRLEAFENCREQGYRICNYNWNDEPRVQTIAFSEHRNRDSIVIYHSSKHEEYAFGYSEEFWDNAKYFRCEDFSGAVDYIVELITQ